jgi:hypothetical protein
MDRCIVHNENRLQLWPFATQRKELLYEILKDSAICGSLVDASKDNAVLCIYGQYLKSLLTLESGNLNWSHTEGRLSYLSKSTLFVTARFIYKNIVIQAEARILQIIYVQVLQISISCLCYTANCFFGPTAGFQHSSYTGSCYIRIELVQHKEHHLVPV